MVTFRPPGFVNRNPYDEPARLAPNLRLVENPLPKKRMEPEYPDIIEKLLLEPTPTGRRGNNASRRPVK
jgi:hypothetical protein